MAMETTIDWGISTMGISEHSLGCEICLFSTLSVLTRIQQNENIYTYTYNPPAISLYRIVVPGYRINQFFICLKFPHLGENLGYHDSIEGHLGRVHTAHLSVWHACFQFYREPSGVCFYFWIHDFIDSELPFLHVSEFYRRPTFQGSEH